MIADVIHGDLYGPSQATRLYAAGTHRRFADTWPGRGGSGSVFYPAGAAN